MATAFIRGSPPLSHIPRCRSSNINCYLSLPSFNLSKRICFCSSCCYYSKSRYFNLSFIKSDGTQLDSLSAVPDPRESGILDDDRRTDDPDGGQQQIKVGTEGELRDAESKGGLAAVLGAIPEGNSAVISACLVGLLTGISVVVFNNGVHEIRDFFWDGIPYRGASWLREEPVEVTWGRTVLVPVCGGLLVGMLTIVQESLEKRRAGGPGMLTTHAEQVLRPFIRSIAACITLGTGNSLGPEGPSVEIGSSVAKGVGTLFDKTGERKVSLAAAGSAAGISSGFSAAVSGCFFGVESVLWPSPSDSSTSLTNTTSMIILSAVIASVVSEIGLGSEPTFKVPDYDFRSPSELPLYLLLGGLCGLVSLALSRCTSYMTSAVDQIHEAFSISRAVFPLFGGLSVGLMALAYPEILYWGFENVDILLESRPFVKGLSADLLLQLVAVKIVATSLCRASGLVGGYYAPSLFIGAATGMAYGKFIAFTVSQLDPIFQIPLFEVASPQAYGLVGMSATLAGVCQVPLTSVLLLFELTQDYRIVLPLLGAVGLSSWITSLPMKKKDIGDREKNSGSKYITENSGYPDDIGASNAKDLLGTETSPCLDDFESETEELEMRIFVSQAMRTRYATVLKSTLLTEAVAIMLAEKQSYALVIDSDSIEFGVLLLAAIQEFSNSAKARTSRPEELSVAEIYAEIHCTSWAVTPDMDLLSAKMIMMRHNLSLLPVVSEHDPAGIKGQLVGVVDRECIRLACRAVMIKERLEHQ